MKDKITKFVEENMSEIKKVGQKLWENPEIAGEEFHSVKLITNTLRNFGYSVELGYGGFPTGFLAEYKNGDGGPVIGLLGDFDALPELSTVYNNKAGHGCMHNLYAATAVGVAITLANLMRENGIKGTIQYIGAPAEEDGGSKQYFARQGLLNEVDIFIGLHPVPHSNGVMFQKHLASASLLFTFIGKPSHAALQPEHGRNALAASEYFNVGTNYIRGQINSNVRINYVYKESSNIANIIPKLSVCEYSIRSENIEILDEVVERIVRLAKNAADSMLCDLEITELSKLSDSRPNHKLAEIVYQSIEEIGIPEFTEEEQKLAYEKGYNKGYLMKVTPLPEKASIIHGSTDEGDISQLAPWIRINMATVPQGLAGHSYEMTYFSNVDAAYKGISKTIQIASYTIVKLLKDSSLLIKANDEFESGKIDSFKILKGKKLPELKRFKTTPGVEIKDDVLSIDFDKTIIFDSVKDGMLVVTDENGRKVEKNIESNFVILKLERELGGILTVQRRKKQKIQTISYIRKD